MTGKFKQQNDEIELNKIILLIKNINLHWPKTPKSEHNLCSV